MGTQKLTIGCIGAGNMGGAILEGLVARHVTGPESIRVYDKDGARSRDFAQRLGVVSIDSSRVLVEESRIVILAVKPQDLDGVSGNLKAVLTSEHVVISILAGIPLEKLSEKLGREARLVRAMPNLGAKVSQSLTALASSSEEALKDAEVVFNACGKTLRLEEHFFDLVTALSGSGPAYFFWLMELMAGMAVSHGMPAETARVLAVQTAAGAALLAMESGEEPSELRRKVTSKGGTTEAALNVLNQAGADKVIRKAFEAAEARGRELRGG